MSTINSSSSSSSSKYNNNVNKKNNIANQYKRISLEKLAQSNEGVYKNARFMNVSLILMGCPVSIKCKSGDTFHGIFATFSPEYEVVLECCHKVDLKNEVVICGRSLPSKGEVKTLIFPKEDIVEIVAVDVDRDYAITSGESTCFTDSAIAQKINGNKGQGDRALEPFAFGEIDENPDIDLESTKGWSVEDMLSINEAKYGYKSTYKSDLSEYTVAVEKEDTDDYKRREEEAERMATEIESSSTYRNNVDKELSDNEEEEAAFSAVERTTQDYVDNDADSTHSGYSNSYTNSRDKFINSNNKRNNRPFDPRNKQRNSSSNLQNSSNQNLNSSYKRYPSSGNNLNNTNQSKSSFERTNSNIESSTNSRQYYSPLGSNSNTVVDSQVYHNRRSKEFNNNNNNNNNKNINNNDTKKNYKNNSQQQQQQQQKQLTVQTTENDSVENQVNTPTTTITSTTETNDTTSFEQNVNSSSSSKKEVLKTSSPIQKKDDSSVKEQASSAAADNQTSDEKNNNDNTTATTLDDSTSSDATRSKLNPFAQEFNPLNMARTPQILSPINTNVYVPMNQPSYTPNPNTMQLQSQPNLSAQIYVNPNSQPVFIINQPYPQPTYIPSPAPQPQPPAQQPAPSHLKSKKGTNEAAPPPVHQMVQMAPPPPRNHQITYQQPQQYAAPATPNPTIVTTPYPPQPGNEATHQMHLQPINMGPMPPHQVHQMVPQRNHQIAYQQGGAPPPQYTPQPPATPNPTMVAYSMPPPQQQQQPGNEAQHQMMVHQMGPPPQRIITYDANGNQYTTIAPQQMQGAPYAPNQVIYTTQQPMNYQPNPNGQQMTIRYMHPNQPQLIQYQPNEQQQQQQQQPQHLQPQTVYTQNGEPVQMKFYYLNQ